jgi:pyrimidine-nucleoside phosphorylase
MSFSIAHFLAERRDGAVHRREDLLEFARLAGSKELPDYQISAWLMAAYLNPLSLEETVGLTLGMAESGERLDLTGLPKPWVDKHSTGGVGDKTTLVLLPLLAACGLTMVKMSGRGLGITGGTIDKLASIPGFRTDLSSQEMIEQASRIGLALTGQTPALAPADGVLYGLRDVTQTVASIPLIVSSILSKKIAGGAEVIGLDVKCGSGAFMPTAEAAEELATWLSKVGKACGLSLHVTITDMDQPLGQAAGNLIEVLEAFRVLSRQALSPNEKRFETLCIELATETLVAVGQHDAKAVVEKALDDGKALEKALEWTSAQGATTSPLDLTLAEPRQTITATQSGFAQQVSALRVGEAVLEMGGGRKKKTDVIDLTVGVVTLVQVGDKIEAGQPLFHLHGNPDQCAAAAAVLQDAVTVVQAPVEPRPLILKRL